MVAGFRKEEAKRIIGFGFWCSMKFLCKILRQCLAATYRFCCSMKFSCARIKFPSERKSENHAFQDRIKINESAEKCFSDTPVVSFLMVDRL